MRSIEESSARGSSETPVYPQKVPPALYHQKILQPTEMGDEVSRSVTIFKPGHQIPRADIPRRRSRTLSFCQIPAGAV
jgi:hypothetical protein